MTLSQQQRKLAALAAAIHADLAQPKAPSVRPALPEVPWQSCRHQLRLLELAQRRGYHATAIELQEDLRQSLVGLEATISQIRGQLPARQPYRLCSPREIYRDLRGLYDEFPEVRWSKKQGSLSVTTEPIELESRYLGPFKIELYWRGSGGHASYSVLALDPQPASGSSDVTHPHVLGEQLCEGEGTTAIRAALRDGRLLDFFLIVSNLLHTYNSNSPYVALNEWDGVRCSECDYRMDDDESRRCERCEATLCCECTRCCCDCSDTACSSCSLVCPGCEENLCRSCAKSCRDCGQSFCSSCLENDERCRSCHEDSQEQADREESDAAVLAVCVGQVALPTGSG